MRSARCSNDFPLYCEWNSKYNTFLKLESLKRKAGC